MSCNRAFDFCVRLVFRERVDEMTIDFTEMLKPFLAISKISGLMNFCCTLESGLLFRDMRLTYHLFLEGLRMLIYVICTYHICYNMGLNYIFLQFNIIKYWSIVLTARMSEKWIIRYKSVKRMLIVGIVITILLLNCVRLKKSTLDHEKL